MGSSEELSLEATVFLSLEVFSLWDELLHPGPACRQLVEPMALMDQRETWFCFLAETCMGMLTSIRKKTQDRFCVALQWGRDHDWKQKKKKWSYRLLEPQGFGTVLKCQRCDPRKDSGMDGGFVMGGEKAIASDVAHSVPGKDDVTKPRWS